MLDDANSSRICPGRHLAEASVWIVMVTMLATMNITKAVDANGKEIIPDVELTPGLTRYELPLSLLLQTANRDNAVIPHISLAYSVPGLDLLKNLWRILSRKDSLRLNNT